MSLKSRKHSVDIVFILLAALIFAGSVLLVLTLGAGAYSSVSSNIREGGDEKLALTYIATKLRGADEAGMLSVVDFDGLDALCIREEADGYLYNTLIYAYDGYLCELYFEDGLELEPEAGEKLLKGASLTLTPVTDRLLLVDFVGQAGNARRLYVGLKSEGRWQVE